MWCSKTSHISGNKCGGGGQSPRVNQYFILMLTLQLYLRQTGSVTKLDLKQFKYIH